MPISLPDRLLLGPGPSNVHPDVLAAMASPLVGHMDPAFHAVLEEVQERLRRLFGTENAMTLPLSTTGSGGMEACFANTIEPGDRALVGVHGVFGERMAEVARRYGAAVTRVESEPGKILDPEEMSAAIARVEPAVVAFVHAETSTGVCQPVDEIARTGREHGALVVLDCVTSLSGLPLTLDAWGVDAAYSGTQKCLSCPPGLSPATFGPRVLERVAARTRPVPVWYLDLSLLDGYFGSGDRVYHHTAPVSAILGLAEALRRVEDEGLETRERRHRDASARLLAGLEPLGFEPLVEAAHRLPMLNAVRLPESLQPREAALRGRLLERHGIEVGAGLGKLAGQIWRIGLMGENARPEPVDRLLGALRDELG